MRSRCDLISLRLIAVRVPAFGQVAQLVEHVTENHGVGGSIPSLATTYRPFPPFDSWWSLSLDASTGEALLKRSASGVADAWTSALAAGSQRAESSGQHAFWEQILLLSRGVILLRRNRCLLEIELPASFSAQISSPH